MKHIFVVNPVSGNGKGAEKILAPLLDYLKKSDLEYEVHRSLNKEEIGSYVKQRAQDGQPVRFYAVGGDGTLCDVMNGAIGFENAEVGTIPCGTGNDFVRNFTNKENFLDFEKLIAGTAMSIDVLRYGKSYAINMLNVGADCDVVAKAAKYKKGSGASSYSRAALDILPKGPKYRMIYTDENGEEHEEDLLLCAIANGHYCGGGFKSCPRAKLDDGLLDVVISRPVTGLKMMKLLYKYRQGTHMDNDGGGGVLQYMQMKEFKLSSMEPVNISVDGEVESFVRAEVSIVPKAIKFVVPQGSEPI